MQLLSKNKKQFISPLYIKAPIMIMHDLPTVHTTVVHPPDVENVLVHDLERPRQGCSSLPSLSASLSPHSCVGYSTVGRYAYVVRSRPGRVRNSGTLTHSHTQTSRVRALFFGKQARVDEKASASSVFALSAGRRDDAGARIRL